MSTILMIFFIIIRNVSEVESCIVIPGEERNHRAWEAKIKKGIDMLCFQDSCIVFKSRN